MDFKYIEQLLSAYWRCETTPEEEAVLRAFFRQADLPPQLARYRSLFVYEDQAAGEHLGADFDERMLALVEQAKPSTTPTPQVRAVRRHFNLRPFARAAAVVAVVLTIGNAAQHQFGQKESEAPDYNYATYKDTYTDPQVALDEVSSAIKALRVAAPAATPADTALAGKALTE